MSSGSLLFQGMVKWKAGTSSVNTLCECRSHRKPLMPTHQVPARPRASGTGSAWEPRPRGKAGCPGSCGPPDRRHVLRSLHIWIWDWSTPTRIVHAPAAHLSGRLETPLEHTGLTGRCDLKDPTRVPRPSAGRPTAAQPSGGWVELDAGTCQGCPARLAQEPGASCQGQQQLPAAGRTLPVRAPCSRGQPHV